MQRGLAIGLSLLLLFGVMTAWVTDIWAVYLLYSLVFLLGAIWATFQLVSRRPVRFNLAGTLVLTIAAWGTVQLAAGATVNRWASMNATLLWTANALLFFLCLQLFSKLERREAFLRWLLYGGVLLAVEALFQYYTADQKIFWLFKITGKHPIVMGPILYHNHFAAIILLILPIGIYYSSLSARNLLTHGWMVGVLAGAVFASQSRSGSALVVLELVFLLPLVGRHFARRAKLVMIGMVLLLVVGGVAVAGWDRLWERFHHFDRSRLDVFAMSIRMIRDKPAWGYGLGTWPSVGAMYAPWDDGLFWNEAHNDWLQMAAEGGVALAALLAGFAGIVSVGAFRCRWGAGVPAVLVLCLVDFPLQKPIVSLLLFALAGAISASTPPATDWRLFGARRDRA